MSAPRPAVAINPLYERGNERSRPAILFHVAICCPKIHWLLFLEACPTTLSIHVIMFEYVISEPASICSRILHHTPSALSSQSSASNNVGISFLINCRSQENRSVGRLRKL